MKNDVNSESIASAIELLLNEDMFKYCKHVYEIQEIENDSVQKSEKLNNLNLYYKKVVDSIGVKIDKSLLNNYAIKWYKIFKENNEIKIKKRNSSVNATDNNLLNDQLNKTKELEVEVVKLTNENTRLMKIMKTSRSHRVKGLLFLLLVTTSIALTIIIANEADHPELKVSIIYNVGEIIAGILAGVGVASAGLAYAIKTLKSENNE